MRILFIALMLAACGTKSSTPTDGEGSASDAAQENTVKKTGAKEAPVDFSAPSDVAAAPADAKTTQSGLAWKVLTAGSGQKHPSSTSEVEVHYTGWTTDGEMFDSSRKRNQAATFPLNRVIAGWTEGVQLMVEGETTRFWIPEGLAYKGRSGAPAGMLVFDIELVSIVPGLSEKYPAPSDVAEAPADAQRTESGLAYRVLKAGTGTAHPAGTDRVEVNYTGWQTDGTTFDTSYKRGRSASFPLNAVIPGWTEGLQLMVTGEKTRFWIPSELAYADRPGRPQGMLVFDIELLSSESSTTSPK